MGKQTQIERCMQCGNYLAELADGKRCADCAAKHREELGRVENAIFNEGITGLARIAERTGLTEDTVRRIIRVAKPLAERAEVEFTCARCRKKPTQPGSDFCLNCRIDLDKELGAATAQLGGDAAAEPAGNEAGELVDPPTVKPPDNVETAVKGKRKRTSISRIRPRPQRLK